MLRKPNWQSYTHHDHYLVHDEYNACRAGDVVRLLPGMRSSKHKKHVVAEVITPFGTGERKPIETEEEWQLRKSQKEAAKLERRNSEGRSRKKKTASAAAVQSFATDVVENETTKNSEVTSNS